MPNLIEKLGESENRAEEALRSALDETRKRETEVSALLEGTRAVLKHRSFEEA